MNKSKLLLPDHAVVVSEIQQIRLAYIWAFYFELEINQIKLIRL